MFRGQKWEANKEPTPFEYRRVLMPGLNAWIAGNSTGKSTILKTLLWAITGEKPNFKSDVLEWLRDVYVEIEIVDEGIYTIHYSPRIESIGVSGGIFGQEIADVIQGKEGDYRWPFTGYDAMKSTIGQFFSKRAGFVSLEWFEKSTDTVNLTKRTVSWDVYAQALNLSSDDTSDFMFPNHQYSKHHQKAIRMYLG